MTTFLNRAGRATQLPPDSIQNTKLLIFSYKRTGEGYFINFANKRGESQTDLSAEHYNIDNLDKLQSRLEKFHLLNKEL